MDKNRKWALEQMKSDETDRIVDALLSLSFYDEDWEYVENICYETIHEGTYRYRQLLSNHEY